MEHSTELEELSRRLMESMVAGDTTAFERFFDTDHPCSVHRQRPVGMVG